MDPSEVVGEKPFWYVLIRVHRAGQAFSRQDVSRLIRNLREDGTLATAKLVGTDIWALGHVAEMRYEDAKSFMTIELDGGLSRGLGPVVPGENTFVLEQWICSYGQPMPAVLFDD
jgi:hypothetical protein